MASSQQIPAEPREPVSAKIINQAGRHRAAVDRALSAIDRVHVDGPLHPNWAAGDFKPISEAFDDLFRRKGWLK